MKNKAEIVETELESKSTTNIMPYMFWVVGFMFTFGITGHDPTVQAMAIGWKIVLAFTNIAGWPIWLGMTISRAMFQ